MLNDQVTPAETAEILRLAELCLNIPGDFVELGCYRGDTSVLLGKLLQANPVENLCKSPTEPVDKMCKKSINHVENMYKNSNQPVDNLCKTASKFVENQSKTTNFQWKTTDINVENLCKNHPNSVQNLCKTTKNLWIYDSFAGLPEKTVADCSGAGRNFQKGELSASKREVVEKLRRAGLKTANRPSIHTSHPDAATSSNLTSSVVIVKKAWFDDLQSEDLPEHIAFAFLDGDLYSSIQTSLKLVTPRLDQQGIIIVHDYNNPELPGSARAVDEFLRAHPEYKLTQKYTLAILQHKC